ncbi:histidine phosphatase family protein [Euzebya pacifica]|uniref:histidine phosphatase family protein n=1 Tax=Euzebya pacifica TaxID=1608957 RepID=UPI000DF863DD|nr:histidine phosphatase family protein [Euzebya pacifica]
MVATVHLIRHAVTAATGTRLGGRTDAPLSEKGRHQAEATRDHLAAVDYHAIYASPLPRTTETAEIIAKPHRKKVRAAEGMIEVDYGRWTDRPLKPLFKNKLWPVIQQTPSLVTFPDGESIRAAQERAVTAIEQIATRHDKRTVAVVSHADIIKAVVAFYVGMPLDTFQRLVISPASVTVLTTGKGARPTLHSFNHVPPVGGDA